MKPQEQSSVVKDYSFSPTKVSMALLTSNDCVYFYNLEKKCLTGTQLFNKRHHGATNVLFNPIMNNVLVVYGGPNGLIVYNLEDTHQFLHQPLHKGSKHHIVIKKDACTYNFATFSHNGRYLALIKDSLSIELLDFHGESEQSISTPIRFNLGLPTLYGEPAYLSFSPRDTYLALSYKPLSNDQCYSSLLKIYDFTTQKFEDWKFNHRFHT